MDAKEKCFMFSITSLLFHNYFFKYWSLKVINGYNRKTRNSVGVFKDLRF